MTPELPDPRPVDPKALAAARARQERLTKPAGSLGRLEDVAVRVAGVLGSSRPAPRGAAIAVFASDHLVTRHGVSAYPPEVTGQMVTTMLAGRAAVCALARAAGARMLVVDVGVDGPRRPGEGSAAAGPLFWDRKVRRGSRDPLTEDAMTAAELAAALAAGREAAAFLAAGGADLLVGGEMGIGNTTPAAALTAALLRLEAERLVGRGTGVDDAGLERKRAVVAGALRRRSIDPNDPLDALRAVGGLDLAALAGFYLEGAARGCVLLLDGFIATAAALVAVRLRPAAAGFMVAGHLSQEQGHARQLEALGLEPLLRLGMRLGEGSGAVLALPLVRAAAATLREMVTFEEAGVSG